ncbi:hypothetical protein BDF14DRAFT_1798803 [Spinellus fusiger]|nr:hypothetical protein BDF14DRAFT_1798803 [Spinellus fusiger]
MTTQTFQIPFERRPGTDITTKNLLKHPEVKDIVTKAVADSEWADDTQSDVLYAPKDKSLGHAPIIVEVQHSVNFAFVPNITCVGCFLYQCNKWHPNQAP